MSRRRVHVKACGSEPARREPAQLETPAGLAALQLHWAGRGSLRLCPGPAAAGPTIRTVRDSPEWQPVPAAAILMHRLLSCVGLACHCQRRMKLSVPGLASVACCVTGASMISHGTLRLLAKAVRNACFSQSCVGVCHLRLLQRHVVRLVAQCLCSRKRVSASWLSRQRRERVRLKCGGRQSRLGPILTPLATCVLFPCRMGCWTIILKRWWRRLPIRSTVMTRVMVGWLEL